MICNLLKYSVFLIALAVSMQAEVPEGREAYSISINSPDEITAIKYSPDGLMLAYGTEKGDVLIIETISRKSLFSMRLHEKQVTTLLFDKKNEYLISGALDENICVTELELGRPVYQVNTDFKIKTIDLNYANNRLAVAGESKKIALYEFPGMMEKPALENHKKELLYLSYDNPDNLLYSVCKDNRLVIWDMNIYKTQQVIVLEPKTKPAHSWIRINSIDIRHDVDTIVIGYSENWMDKGQSGMIKRHNIALYNKDDGKLIRPMGIMANPISFIQILSSRPLVMATQEHDIRFIDLNESRAELIIPIDSRIEALALSPKEDWLAAAVAASDETPNQIRCIPINIPTDRKARAIDCEIVGISEPLIRSDDSLILAVPYLKSIGYNPEIGQKAANYLNSFLANFPNLTIVERNQIEHVLEELELSEYGLTENEYVRLGRQIGANYVISGNVNSEGERFVITVNLLDVASGKNQKSLIFRCEQYIDDNLLDIIKDLMAIIVEKSE